jgi:hypothetical protein
MSVGSNARSLTLVRVTSRALPKFESYLAVETAAFFGLKAQAATVRFHGIGRLVDLQRPTQRWDDVGHADELERSSALGSQPDSVSAYYSCAHEALAWMRKPSAKPMRTSFHLATLDHTGPVVMGLHCTTPGRILISLGHGAAFANGCRPCPAHLIGAILRNARRAKRGNGAVGSVRRLELRSAVPARTGIGPPGGATLVRIRPAVVIQRSVDPFVLGVGVPHYVA